MKSFVPFGRNLIVGTLAKLTNARSILMFSQLRTGSSWRLKGKPSTALWIAKAASTDMSSSPCFQWHPGNSLAVKRLARCLLLRIFHPLLIHHLLWNAPKEKLRSTLKPYSTVNIPFNQALTKVRKLDLDTKKSKTDKKTERRDCYRKSKACLEEHWKKTSVMR